MPCSAAVGGADLGAHVAVLDGDVAHGIAHQTAQRSIVAARDGALDVEVADGGAIGIVERGAVALAGLQVERQRIALSVERTLERVTARARHLRRTDACAEFHGLAAEAVEGLIISYECSKVSPSFG